MATGELPPDITHRTFFPSNVEVEPMFVSWNPAGTVEAALLMTFTGQFGMDPDKDEVKITVVLPATHVPGIVQDMNDCNAEGLRQIDGYRRKLN